MLLLKRASVWFECQFQFFFVSPCFFLFGLCVVALYCRLCVMCGELRGLNTHSGLVEACAPSIASAVAWLACGKSSEYTPCPYVVATYLLLYANISK